MLFPRAGGDLFTFVSDQLTVDKSDLRSGVKWAGADPRRTAYAIGW